MGGVEVGIVEGRQVVLFAFEVGTYPALNGHAGGESDEIDGGAQGARPMDATQHLLKFDGVVSGADDSGARSSMEVVKASSSAARLSHHQDDVRGLVLLITVD